MVWVSIQCHLMSATLPFGKLFHAELPFVALIQNPYGIEVSASLQKHKHSNTTIVKQNNSVQTVIVTHHCLLCTLQCIWSGEHLLNQVSHNGRSHQLHFLCDAYVLPSDLWFCENPTGHQRWEHQFHWERTSSLKQEIGNKQLGQLRRAGPLCWRCQCPPGSHYCCSCMFYF